MQLPDLIGFHTITRPYESIYAFVSRLIRDNLLTDIEARQLLPNEWCVHAFSPFETPLGKVTETIREWVSDSTVIAPKVDIRAWQLFSELTSHSSESLRICPTCIEVGQHSFAYQDDLMGRCPVHAKELSCTCPRCHCALVWGDRSHPTQWAFRCPRGCDLCGSTFLGLFEPDKIYQNALKYHLSWVKMARSTFHFVANPTHIAYPPRLVNISQQSSFRLPPGLTAALCDLLRLNGAAIAGCPGYYATSHGQWELVASAWSEEAGIRLLRKRDSDDLIQSFRRGPYTSQLPILSIDRVKSFFEQKDAQGFAEHYELTKKSHVDILSIPSYLITNAEIASLRRIMMSEPRNGAVDSYFMDVLIDLLDDALARQKALNSIDTPSTYLATSDRFDALIDINNRLFRVRGYVRSSVKSQYAWKDYCEAAEIDGGRIYLNSRSGPPH